jgi:hypothetical protein
LTERSLNDARHAQCLPFEVAANIEFEDAGIATNDFRKARIRIPEGLRYGSAVRHPDLP